MSQRTQEVEPTGRRAFVCEHKDHARQGVARLRVFLPQGATEVPSCPDGHGPMRRDPNVPYERSKLA